MFTLPAARLVLCLPGVCRLVEVNWYDVVMMLARVLHKVKQGKVAKMGFEI